jgi:tetratricopeptide (TPR) repeat protein
MAVLLLFSCPSAWCQSNQRPAKPGVSRNAGQSAVNEAAAELQRRLTKLQEAKSSTEPGPVAHASELVIALALRELGQVRLLESSYGQAAELYSRSLNFENNPETRVDLALAEMQAGELDIAIHEADRALVDSPNNGRAFQVLGNAWMQKKDYTAAIHTLTRAAEISPTIENYFTLATAQLATKDPAQRQGAERSFDEMKRIAGDSGSLHVIIGRAYRDAGDLPAAIRQLEIAIKLDPRAPHAHYFLGLAHLAANEWVATPEVKEEFKNELKHYPNDYLANYMLGFVYSAERNYQESEQYLARAATINPASPEPWMYMGLNANSQNDLSRAETCFRKAIQLTGTDYARSNYLIRRAYVDLGHILVASGRKEEAVPFLEIARELQKKSLESSQQGMASHFMEEGAAEAAASAAVVMPSMTEALSSRESKAKANVDPFAQVTPEVMAKASLTDAQKKQAAEQERQLRIVLGQAFSDLGTSEAIRKEYRAAVGHYLEAEKWDPATPDLPRNLGMAAFRAQDYPEAVRGLSAVLGSNPQDASARAMLGMTYFAQDKFKEAAATFDPLGPKGMKDAAVGYAWASSLTKMGELPRATEVLVAFSSEDRPPDVLMLVGQLWIEIADYARAESTFERVLKSDPAAPKAHYFAGQAYLRSEQWDEAAREFQAELLLHPSDLDAKFNLGFVYLQQSRRVDAERLFREVIAAEPEHANAQYEYGKILMDHGDIHGAIAHLEIAARLKPNTDYVHYQLQAAYRKEGRVSDADHELEIYKQIKAKKRERASEAISEKQNP